MILTMTMAMTVCGDGEQSSTQSCAELFCRSGFTDQGSCYQKSTNSEEYP